ncbi:MAG: EAL domain-containing protein [Anaerovoracaceae bacterium]
MENPNRVRLVKHLVEGFNEIGIQVVAEGVENEEQRDAVIDLGCSEIQGFYFAKPMSSDDLIEFWKQ